MGGKISIVPQQITIGTAAADTTAIFGQEDQSPMPEVPSGEKDEMLKDLKNPE